MQNRVWLRLKAISLTKITLLPSISPPEPPHISILAPLSQVKTKANQVRRRHHSMVATRLQLLRLIGPSGTAPAALPKTYKKTWPKLMTLHWHQCHNRLMLWKTVRFDELWPWASTSSAQTTNSHLLFKLKLETPKCKFTLIKWQIKIQKYCQIIC